MWSSQSEGTLEGAVGGYSHPVTMEETSDNEEETEPKHIQGVLDLQLEQDQRAMAMADPAVIKGDLNVGNMQMGRDAHFAENINLHQKTVVKNPRYHQTSIVQNMLPLHEGGYMNLKDQTQKEIELDKDLFVKTSAWHRALHHIERKGCLLIKGPPGSGKTSLVTALLRHYQNQEREPLILKHHQEWRQYVGNKKQVVFIDDIFGKDSFTQEAFNSWSKYFRGIKGYAKGSETIILISIRTDVCKEARKFAVKDEFFTKDLPELDLEEFPLSDNEKQEMLKKHVEGQGKYLNENQLREILHCDKTGATFPFCCQEFSKLRKKNPRNIWIFTRNKDLNSLHRACAHGLDDLVESLIHVGISPETKDCDGMTALHHACIAGQKKVAEVLIHRGVKIDSMTDKGSTSLHLAAKEGNTDVVNTLLAHEAEIDKRNGNRETALHVASKNGHGNTVRLLLEKGADVEAVTLRGAVVAAVSLERKPRPRETQGICRIASVLIKVLRYSNLNCSEIDKFEKLLKSNFFER